jgi:hypothetical protein
MNSSNGQNEAAERDYFFRPENMKSAIKTNTTTMAPRATKEILMT